jgi:hypothetical protein
MNLMLLTKVFLNTELTNFNSPYLISIGMVAESGEGFYAEVPFAQYRLEFSSKKYRALISRGSRSKRNLRRWSLNSGCPD